MAFPSFASFTAFASIVALLIALRSQNTNDTLVVYIFSDTDKEYIHNLRFFVREGIREGDGCEYIIVIQMESDDDDSGQFKPLGHDLPTLPPNARYVNHLNECYDWGTFGWLLSTNHVNVRKYKFFILINSSVRGPFISPLFRPLSRMGWSRILTSRIGGRRKGETRVVGSVISCEGTPKDGDETREKRQSPHVQSYLLATDQLGLDLMRKDGRILSCHRNRWDAIWYGEVGSGEAILGYGYNLDSLMIRYQGINWLDPRNHNCNRGISPSGMNTYDGINLDPYEALFVKVKAGYSDKEPWTATQGDYSRDHLSSSDPSTAMERARQYERWGVMRVTGALSSKESILANHYQESEMRYKLPSIFRMSTIISRCFDFEFYLEQNPDLSSLVHQESLNARDSPEDQGLSASEDQALNTTLGQEANTTQNHESSAPQPQDEELSATPQLQDQEESTVMFEVNGRASGGEQSRENLSVAESIGQPEERESGGEQSRENLSVAESIGQPEEREDLSMDRLWRHFILHGQFEEREFRFKCVDRELKSLIE